MHLLAYLLIEEEQADNTKQESAKKTTGITNQQLQQRFQLSKLQLSQLNQLQGGPKNGYPVLFLG